MFVDYISVICAGNSFSSLSVDRQKDLQLACHHLFKNGIVLNVAKTKFIKFQNNCNKQNHYTLISIKNYSLEENISC